MVILRCKLQNWTCISIFIFHRLRICSWIFSQATETNNTSERNVNMYLINKAVELYIKNIRLAPLIRCSREEGMFDNNRNGLRLHYSFTKLYQMHWHIKAKCEVTLEIPCRWCSMLSFCGFTTLSGLLVVYTQLWLCFLNSQISLSIKKSF